MIRTPTRAFLEAERASLRKLIADEPERTLTRISLEARLADVQRELDHVPPVAAWWFVENSTGADTHVPLPRDRWYDARAQACRQLSEKLGRAVGQDEVAWAFVGGGE